MSPKFPSSAGLDTVVWMIYRRAKKRACTFGKPCLANTDHSHAAGNPGKTRGRSELQEPLSDCSSYPHLPEFHIENFSRHFDAIHPFFQVRKLPHRQLTGVVKHHLVVETSKKTVLLPFLLAMTVRCQFAQRHGERQQLNKWAWCKEWFNSWILVWPGVVLQINPCTSVVTQY